MLVWLLWSRIQQQQQEIDPNTVKDGEVAINLGYGNAYQQQLQLMKEQDTYSQSHAKTMCTIETIESIETMCTIIELDQMFIQRTTMINEQEEVVQKWEFVLNL